MGRGHNKDKSWRGDGGYNGPYTAGWRDKLWKGAFSSPRGQGQVLWKDQAWDKSPAVSFPAFDAKLSVEAAKEEDGRRRESSGDGSIPTRTVQTALNAARRAEQRVDRLARDEQTTHSQWDAYVKAMKQGYVREKKRFQARLDKLKKEQLEAQEQLDIARVAFRSIVMDEEPSLPSAGKALEATGSAADEVFAEWDASAAPDWSGVATRALEGGATVGTPIRVRTTAPMTPAVRHASLGQTSTHPHQGASSLGTPSPVNAVVDPYMAMAMMQQGHAPFPANLAGASPPLVPPGLPSPGQVPRPPGPKGPRDQEVSQGRLGGTTRDQGVHQDQAGHGRWAHILCGEVADEARRFVAGQGGYTFWPWCPGCVAGGCIWTGGSQLCYRDRRSYLLRGWSAQFTGPGNDRGRRRRSIIRSWGRGTAYAGRDLIGCEERSQGRSQLHIYPSTLREPIDGGASLGKLLLSSFSLGEYCGSGAVRRVNCRSLRRRVQFSCTVASLGFDRYSLRSAMIGKAQAVTRLHNDREAARPPGFCETRGDVSPLSNAFSGLPGVYAYLGVLLYAMTGVPRGFDLCGFYYSDAVDLRGHIQLHDPRHFSVYWSLLSGIPRLGF